SQAAWDLHRRGWPPGLRGWRRQADRQHGREGHHPAHRSASRRGRLITSNTGAGPCGPAPRVLGIRCRELRMTQHPPASVEGEALATLIVNKLRGTFNAVACKAPGFGDRRKAMLQDMAILTGGQVISEEVGLKLDSAQLSSLGKARRVNITKDDTTIVEGGGSADAIKGRIEQIKVEIDKSTSDWDKEKLQERLAKLSGGVAVIKVGAATET